MASPYATLSILSNFFEIMGGVGGNRFGNFARGVGGDMPPDRCGRYCFSVTVAAECAELFPLPEEAGAWENVRYKSGDVNYNTRHPLYNIGHMFYKTAHPCYKISDMRYKSSDVFYKSVDMPPNTLDNCPVCNDNRSPCEITPDRREAHREPHRSS